MAQAEKVWPNILSVSEEQLVYTLGGHISLFDKLKDDGLNIFISLSKIWWGSANQEQMQTSVSGNVFHAILISLP